MTALEKLRASTARIAPRGSRAALKHSARTAATASEIQSNTFTKYGCPGPRGFAGQSRMSQLATACMRNQRGCVNVCTRSPTLNTAPYPWGGFSIELNVM